MNNEQFNNSQENNNQINKEQTNNTIPVDNKQNAEVKQSPVGIIFLLLILIGIGVAVYFNKDSLFGKKEDKLTPTVNEQKSSEEEQKQEPKKEEKKVQKGTLNTEKDLDSVEISINDKKYTLEYKYNEDEGPGAISLKLGNTSIYGENAVDGISNVTYEVFNSATDNKQYLYVSYNFYGTFGNIIDENGKIIKTVSEFYEDQECSITTDEAERSSKNLISVRDGYVYYFKYKGTNLNEETDITLYEVQISIKDSKVTETETGKTTNGHPTNCA